MMKLKDALAEVAPPGFEKAVKVMKKKKSVDNPYAVAWSMKNKGDEPSDDMDEMDASQPNAPSSMAGMDEICEECGMSEGQHMPGCSRMNEFSNDMIGGGGMGLDETEQEDTSCPECDAPHGMKHDKGCPLNTDGEPEHMGGADRKRDIDEEDAVKRRSMRDMLKTPSAEDDDGVRAGFGDREGFETEHGEWIENPFWDESGRDEVEPELHYGDAFKKSGLAKRLRWGESSDYDGLPLTEGSMFDRFDTLVGHRFDGTFDERETETMKLRALIKKVVGEARGCVREDDIEEMKLSVAGPAFGAASSDTDDQDDDGDEDYKVLTPKKAPEPDQSGTRLKSKDKKS